MVTWVDANCDCRYPGLAHCPEHSAWKDPNCGCLRSPDVPTDTPCPDHTPPQYPPDRILPGEMWMITVPGYPTFFLDGGISGITGADHATKLAAKILGWSPDYSALELRQRGVDARRVD